MLRVSVLRAVVAWRTRRSCGPVVQLSVLDPPSRQASERVERFEAFGPSGLLTSCATASRGRAVLHSARGDTRHPLWQRGLSMGRRGTGSRSLLGRRGVEDRPRLHFRLAHCHWPSYSLGHSALCCTPPSRGAAGRDRRHAQHTQTLQAGMSSTPLTQRLLWRLTMVY